MESGLYLPLKDEEGVLGVLVFEADQAGVRHAGPAGSCRYSGQPDRRSPPERAAVSPGPDGGCARCDGGQEAGAPGGPPAEAAALRRDRARPARGRGAHSMAVSGGRHGAGLPADGSGPGAGTGSWSSRANFGEGRELGRARHSVGIPPLHQPGKRPGRHSRSDRRPRSGRRR